MVVKSKGIPQNPLNSGLGIIVICPENMKEASEEIVFVETGGGSWLIFHTLVHGTATTCIFMG